AVDPIEGGGRAVEHGAADSLGVGGDGDLFPDVDVGNQLGGRGGRDGGGGGARRGGRGRLGGQRGAKGREGEDEGEDFHGGGGGGDGGIRSRSLTRNHSQGRGLAAGET